MPRTFGLYEHRSLPLLPRRLFYRRMMWHALVTAAVILASLAIGILGYHVTEDMPWLDSLLNASMILGGMGPVDQLHTVAGKWFASVLDPRDSAKARRSRPALPFAILGPPRPAAAGPRADPVHGAL